jgi:Protein of unknown function (DUF1275)
MPLAPGFLDDLKGVLVPGRTRSHGPLPPLLLSLTFVTGLVDAFSYLVLGHVFVANMTGNVVGPVPAIRAGCIPPSEQPARRKFA